MNRIIEESKYIINLIIKIITYVIYQLIRCWKLLILSMIIIGLYLINNNGLFDNILNNKFVKDITFYRYHNNMYLPLYVVEIIILLLYITFVYKYFRLKDYKQDNISKITSFTRFKNKPFFISKNMMFSNLRLHIWKWNKNGIGKSEFCADEFKESFESSFNKTLIDIEEFKNNKNKIKLIVANPKYRIPKILNWDDRLIELNNSRFILGENLRNKVFVDINDTPHLLIGGITGSGKSILLDNLIYQSAKKGYIVYISDPKEVDFKIWNNVEINSNYRALFDMNITQQIKVSSDLSEVKKDLDDIMTEFATRKIMFSNENCKNINEYNNKKYREWIPSESNEYIPLSRIIFVFDEINELISTKDKKLSSEIEDILIKIAAQGRALGIHLILSTQRPDCELLKGQIRSNLNPRICGRTAERGLSEIVLGKGNYSADTMISKKENGLFITNNNIFFKGYYFNTENKIKEYNEKREKVE